MSLRRLLSCAAVALVAATAVPGVAAAVAPRTSLLAVEGQYMCVVCKLPLPESQSDQADRERAFIQMLVGQGDTPAEIRAAMLVQYGPPVLATPAAHGFGLVAYIVPVVVALALIALLVILIPRWRRAGRRGGGGDAPDVDPLSAADSARLEAELARFDR